MSTGIEQRRKDSCRANILLVGTGRMGRIRASAMHANPKIEFCGVVDTNVPYEMIDEYQVSVCRGHHL